MSPVSWEKHNNKTRIKLKLEMANSGFFKIVLLDNTFLIWIDSFLKGVHWDKQVTEVFDLGYVTFLEVGQEDPHRSLPFFCDSPLRTFVKVNPECSEISLLLIIFFFFPFLNEGQNRVHDFLW